jgi:hypothetical protein
MGQLRDSTIPSDFLAWADRMRVSMPVELVDAVKALGIQVGDWKTLFDKQKELAEQLQKQLKEKHDAHMAAIKDHSESITKMRNQRNELAEGYTDLLAKKNSILAIKD